ncbi:hypothetical protein [Lyngbya aestuarii]|uniref:hypothetical protein n=1 Tax=Lyngbya aestuarii TaxID=118322 RepID=UPI00403D7B52
MKTTRSRIERSTLKADELRTEAIVRYLSLKAKSRSDLGIEEKRFLSNYQFYLEILSP